MHHYMIPRWERAGPSLSRMQHITSWKLTRKGPHNVCNSIVKLPRRVHVCAFSTGGVCTWATYAHYPRICTRNRRCSQKRAGVVLGPRAHTTLSVYRNRQCAQLRAGGVLGPRTHTTLSCVPGIADAHNCARGVHLGHVHTLPRVAHQESPMRAIARGVCTWATYRHPLGGRRS